MTPQLSQAAWRAAADAATRAIPALLAKGYIEAARGLAARSRRFSERAGART